MKRDSHASANLNLNFCAVEDVSSLVLRASFARFKNYYPRLILFVQKRSLSKISAHRRRTPVQFHALLRARARTRACSAIYSSTFTIFSLQTCEQSFSSNRGNGSNLYAIRKEQRFAIFDLNTWLEISITFAIKQVVRQEPRLAQRSIRMQ